MAIVRIDNVLSPDECAILIKLFEEKKELTEWRDPCGWPMIQYTHDLFDEPAKEIIRKSMGTALMELGRRLKVTGQYPEQVLLTGTGEGSFHIPHADNCVKRNDGVWVPNHTPQRSYAVMQYLNGEFEGGELHFPDRGVSMRPKTGMMLVFPADRHHVHEVTRVYSGMRYSLAMWMTDRPEYALNIG